MNIVQLILQTEQLLNLVKEQDKTIKKLEQENIKLKAVKSLTK